MGSVDEKLIAYLDGELGNEARKALEVQLSDSPELAQRLAELRAGDKDFEALLANDAFDEIRPDTVEVATRLAEKLEQQFTGKAHAPSLAEINPKTSDTRFSIRSFVPHAIAASIALMVGFGAGHLVPAKETPDRHYLAGIVKQGSSLYNTLENQPSQAYPSATMNGNQMMTLTSFRTNGGTYCREYVVITREGGNRGLACKREDAWRIQATFALASPETHEGGFVPASDTQATPIDALIMKMMTGDAFSADQEKQAIKDGWRE